MLESLVTGKLYGQPQQRTSKTGKTFATAKVRAACGDGAVFVNVIAFDDQAVAALLAMGDGAGVALAGTATPKAYLKDGEARPALDLVAYRVLTVHQARRQRRKATADTESKVTESCAEPDPEFDDALPF